ncbi:reprolysin-like metallopeptidase [Pleionea sp. CnH1-48]|uniref:reprolysin-like metallopeptidase n=1 Tax=Pleionea sp. CnH1-48 TaxID=2954494 RepID=UPI00209691F7|nr:zinc-dependent metalloprotease family protein [Pleionea sp. CnH1-48]MCO7223954.1 M12 family metallo-peptidase [Pleionea sp. CnH1-48]
MMKKRISCSIISMLLPMSVLADNGLSDIWQDVKLDGQLEKHKSIPVAVEQRRLSLAKDLLAAQLLQAPQKAQASHGIEVELPLPDGKFARFQMFESSIMEPGLAQKFPSIKTFSGFQVDKPENKGRFDLTPQGFHGMFKYNGDIVYIDPEQQSENYIAYYRSKAIVKDVHKKFKDRVKRGVDKHSHKAERTSQASTSITDGVQRSYRIAVAVTGEYTQFHGGTKEKGMAAVTTTINRVNQVYENDLAIRLVLVANNDSLIYTDASSDPYTNTDTDLDTNTGNINNVIGAANYDIGHIFQTADGGVAGFEVVCGAEKGAGLTGTSNPTGDAFNIDYVAHEIGHQFGAEHSFNGCGGNRVAQWAFEPGSGSTIMSYAGLCGDTDLQRNSDALFHTKSISQMFQFASAGGGNACATKQNTGNNIPVVNAGSDYVIPARTPFKLTGSATDADSADQSLLTYIWEQIDLGTESSDAASMVDDGSRPIFRSFVPVSHGTRIFPQLSDVLSGGTTKGEYLPTTNRDLNFRLTVRDTKGGVAYDDAKLTVKSNAGPFKITSPAAAANWTGGAQQSIQWDVANTNTSPINCTSVDVHYSSDGGQSFPTELLKATANDGSENITVPSASTSQGRIRVTCSDNVFFAINSQNITISGSGGGGNQAPQITGQSSLSVQQGQPITLALSNLTVTDPDNNYPADFTMTVMSGSNYTHSGLVVTPAASFSGTLTVPVKVNDGQADSNIFNLSITVQASGGGNQAPQITGQSSLSVQQGQSITLALSNLTVTDPDNNYPADFTMTIMDGSNYTHSGLVVTPTAGFSGTLTVPVKVNDGQADSNTFNLSITVQASGGGNGGNNGGNNGGGSSGGGGSMGIFISLLLLLKLARRKS